MDQSSDNVLIIELDIIRRFRSDIRTLFIRLDFHMDKSMGV